MLCFVCWCFDIFPDEEKTAIVTYFLMYVYLSHSCSIARPIIRLLFLFSSFFQQPTATQNTKTEKLKRKWRVEIRFFTFYFHTQNTNSPQYRMLKRSLKPLARLASASSSSSFLSSSRFVLELFLQAIENFFREESAVFRHLQSSSFLFHHTKKIQRRDAICKYMMMYRRDVFFIQEVTLGTSSLSLTNSPS